MSSRCDLGDHDFKSGKCLNCGETMTNELWKMQDRCKGLAAQAVMSANKIYGETGAATLDQGSLKDWRRVYVQLEGLSDVLADLENNLTTITGGE